MENLCVFFVGEIIVSIVAYLLIYQRWNVCVHVFSICKCTSTHTLMFKVYVFIISSRCAIWNDFWTVKLKHPKGEFDRAWFCSKQPFWVWQQQSHLQWVTGLSCSSYFIVCCFGRAKIWLLIRLILVFRAVLSVLFPRTFRNAISLSREFPDISFCLSMRSNLQFAPILSFIQY